MNFIFLSLLLASYNFLTFSAPLPTIEENSQIKDEVPKVTNAHKKGSMHNVQNRDKMPQYANKGVVIDDRFQSHPMDKLATTSIQNVQNRDKMSQITKMGAGEGSSDADQHAHGQMDEIQLEYSNQNESMQKGQLSGKQPEIIELEPRDGQIAKKSQTNLETELEKAERERKIEEFVAMYFDPNPNWETSDSDEGGAGTVRCFCCFF